MAKCISGRKRFNAFYPSDIKINSKPPRVLITCLNINNKEIKVDQPGTPLQKDIKSTKLLTLNYNQQTFSFNFLAINYLNTEKNQYAYMLDGFDKGWVHCGTRRTAFYTQVPHGKYTFRVKAANNDGVWNEAGTQLSVVILPPLWATWWARVIYVFIPLVLLYFFRKYSIIAVEAKNQMKLDQLEKEKVKEVYDMKMRFFMNISHEFRTPLTLIIDPIENALSQLKEESNIKKALQLSHKNAQRMLGLVNQLLEFRKIESGNTQLRVSSNDIVAFVADIAASFREKANNRSITLEVKANPECILAWFDKDKLQKIITNLLSNAFKYTGDKGRISILVTVITAQLPSTKKGGSKLSLKIMDKPKLREFVQIEVEDTGKGIASDQVEKIFERFYQVKDSHQKYRKGLALAYRW
ncbi:MAG: hypothetical protein HC896_11990 [Bacteroidales bacterium]|nr:hypothetical protein [Bacteroidales bacterium]